MTETIPFERIIQYRDANTPIVPLFANGDPNTRNIFTKHGLEALPLQLPEDLRKTVYKDNDKNVKPLKLLALQDIKDFWTDDRIRKQEWKGIACQTGYIAALSAIVVGVDADDQKTRYILEKRIEEFGLLNKSIIQDTPHGGKHAIFKIPIDQYKNLLEQIDFWGKRSLRPGMCKDDCIMEIKLRTMQVTLDPTEHRCLYSEEQCKRDHKTPGRRYTRTSNVLAIADLPML